MQEGTETKQTTLTKHVHRTQKACIQKQVDRETDSAYKRGWGCIAKSNDKSIVSNVNWSVECFPGAWSLCGQMF